MGSRGVHRLWHRFPHPQPALAATSAHVPYLYGTGFRRRTHDLFRSQLPTWRYAQLRQRLNRFSGNKKAARPDISDMRPNKPSHEFCSFRAFFCCLNSYKAQKKRIVVTKMMNNKNTINAILSIF